MTRYESRRPGGTAPAVALLRAVLHHRWMPDHGITVTGHGSAAAAPDVLVLDLACEATSTSVQEALDVAAAGLRAVRAALQELGLAESDLRSGDTSVWAEPLVDGPTGRRSPRHTARLGLRATVRDVAAAGTALGAALRAGGETARLGGMSFAHSDPADLAARAREKAVEDARRKAEQLAVLTGRRLGEVVAVTESDPAARPFARAAVQTMATEHVPVDAGEQEVRAGVVVSWDWA